MLPALCRVLSPGHPQKTHWIEAGLYLQVPPNSRGSATLPRRRIHLLGQPGFSTALVTQHNTLAGSTEEAGEQFKLPLAESGFSSAVPGSSPGAAASLTMPRLCTTAPAGMAQAALKNNYILFPSNGSSFLVGEEKKHKPNWGENKRGMFADCLLCVVAVCCVSVVALATLGRHARL